MNKMNLSDNIQITMTELSLDITEIEADEHLLSQFYADTEDDSYDCSDNENDDIQNQILPFFPTYNPFDYCVNDANVVDYANQTVKYLTRIHEYYNLPKLKQSKKNDIIDNIVAFETNTANNMVVIRRKQLWFYLEELRHDKYTKQFIFWI